MRVGQDLLLISSALRFEGPVAPGQFLIAELCQFLEAPLLFALDLSIRGEQATDGLLHGKAGCQQRCAMLLRDERAGGGLS
ncbi:hypothetical protein [Thermogemmatispora sp.]|uniref:hypothetical protein n=1 Tax=Thermogemmatispora sp. TaxID=1968838 RepID=UPI0035E42375